MEDEVNRELDLLPSSRADSSLLQMRSTVSSSTTERGAPSLDLQLSISVRQPAVLMCEGVEALKWQAAEQIRLAAMEKAYAERVRELTRREMEMAQSEFARARQMWERAREEVERAERMKERATRQVDSTCMEITCHSCRQRFRPA
ncbi:zinc finger protein SHOOT GRAVITROPISM 5 [Gastrolobium bilobum]|uniref:zinc finger protein SHOOT GRAVITROPISM 5 n=1 Tax=Gastrolobium bilobum TaxID=150636 RepID=UPI002AAF7110|nr:zinc finger protein SHOOT GRAVITROPISM 5 [Gastrolobium bilobum]